MRQALQGHDATFPNQLEKRVQDPTVQRLFHYLAKIHLLIAPGPCPPVVNLTDEHRNLLSGRGKRIWQFMTANIQANQKGHAKCNFYVVVDNYTIHQARLSSNGYSSTGPSRDHFCRPLVLAATSSNGFLAVCMPSACAIIHANACRTLWRTASSIST
jgi:hypothetical protein